MKYLIIISLVLLSGCSLFEAEAGRSHYVYERIDADGSTHRIDLQNAKDVGSIEATVEYGDIKVMLKETDVSASSPMSVMVEQNRMMAEMVQRLMAIVPGV